MADRRNRGKSWETFKEGDAGQSHRSNQDEWIQSSENVMTDPAKLPGDFSGKGTHTASKGRGLGNIDGAFVVTPHVGGQSDIGHPVLAKSVGDCSNAEKVDGGLATRRAEVEEALAFLLDEYATHITQQHLKYADQAMRHLGLVADYVANLEARIAACESGQGRQKAQPHATTSGADGATARGGADNEKNITDNAARLRIEEDAREKGNNGGFTQVQR